MDGWSIAHTDSAYGVEHRNACVYRACLGGVSIVYSTSSLKSLLGIADRFLGLSCLLMMARRAFIFNVQPDRASKQCRRARGRQGRPHPSKIDRVVVGHAIQKAPAVDSNKRQLDVEVQQDLSSLLSVIWHSRWHSIWHIQYSML